MTSSLSVVPRCRATALALARSASGISMLVRICVSILSETSICKQDLGRQLHEVTVHRHPSKEIQSRVSYSDVDAARVFHRPPGRGAHPNARADLRPGPAATPRLAEARAERHPPRRAPTHPRRT